MLYSRAKHKYIISEVWHKWFQIATTILSLEVNQLIRICGNKLPLLDNLQRSIINHVHGVPYRFPVGPMACHSHQQHSLPRPSPWQRYDLPHSYSHQSSQCPSTKTANRDGWTRQEKHLWKTRSSGPNQLSAPMCRLAVTAPPRKHANHQTALAIPTDVALTGCMIHCQCFCLQQCQTCWIFPGICMFCAS